MTQSTLFSSGIELASFVTSSGLLSRSWDVISSRHAGIISNVGVGLSWKVYKEPGSDLTIIAFEATSDSSNLQADLVSSSDLREKNFLHFDLLCSKSNPVFSVNNTAISLFHENHQKLDQLKSEIDNFTRRTPLIVTGHALGGSVASLFTISLFDSKDTRMERPLCITFGSLLIGDKKLQQAISCSSWWISCFLHVLSHRDPLPTLFITDPTSAYMPFGTFLLLSDANSTCFENPVSIFEILMALGSIHDKNQGFQYTDYGNIVESLNLNVIYNDFTTQAEDMNHLDSLTCSISLQLQALGLTPHVQLIDNNILVTKIKELEERFSFQRRILFDPYKKLEQIKGHMFQLECYKKATEGKGIGYYDSYKNKKSPWDRDATMHHEKLTLIWTRFVEEAEMKPQKEGAAFRIRWLYTGTMYRRMVEPLVIAQYYRKGGKDYVTKQRSKHFKLLEDWLMEKLWRVYWLTIDSCFWAHVEEALLSCRELEVVRENEEVLKKLLEFEEYVYGLLKNYGVSPDIFFPESSYMRWWNEYKTIKRTSYNSALANFMNDARNREQYALGAYDFP